MIGRRGALLGAAGALAARPARALQDRYVFDQSAGQLTFEARHLGLMRSTGRFEAFGAEVVLDRADATRAAVDVRVRTQSVTLPFPGAEELLRSEAFFDVARYPEARFRGQAEGAGVQALFPLVGELTVRGVTRPFAMEARLEGRAVDPALGQEVATFSARGELSRAAYGMTADRLMIEDMVSIGVQVRLILGRDGG